MYFENLEIENVGPIKSLELNFPKNEDGSPKPVIFVGKNGSGKSVILSHLMNFFLVAQSNAFKDSDIESGMTFKLRSPEYIRHGEHFYRTKVKVDSGFFVDEIQAAYNRSYFEEKLGYTPLDKNWTQIGSNSSSVFVSNLSKNIPKLTQEMENFTCLYFPANRFEEPAWLNLENLKNRAEYSRTSGMSGNSDRRIINYSPLKQNQDWLLDIIYDSHAIERRVLERRQANGLPLPPILVSDGQATSALNAIGNFLRSLFQMSGNLTFDVGQRGRRRIGVSIGGTVATNNLFSLSTGQTQILNMFLSLIRDFDFSKSPLNSISDIKGCVIVDEIDLHLHADMQFKILPEIIKLFPNVQFVLTSHSPLFLMGMEKQLGPDKFEIIDLPSGNRIQVENFVEFEDAYISFSQSRKFENDVKQKIAQSQMNLVFVEGTTDVDYIFKAAELLDKEELLETFQLHDGEGAGNLKNVYKQFGTEIARALPQKVLLLFDCDTNQPENQKGNLETKTIPAQNSLIMTGIENLFSNTTISKACDHKPEFFDIVCSHSKIERGNKISVPERWKVNKDEKRNLCDWITKNGTKEDFARFSLVFDIIENSLSDSVGISENPDPH